MKPRLQIAAAELQCGLDLRVLGDTDAPGCRDVGIADAAAGSNSSQSAARPTRSSTPGHAPGDVARPSTQIAPSYWSAGWASWGPGEVEQACGQLGPGCHAGCPRRPGRAERGVRAGVWAFRVRVLVTVGPTREANIPVGERLLPRAPKTRLPRQLVPIEPRPRHTGGTLDGEKPQLSTGGDSEPASATLCVGCCCVL
jgi:hypothetical protein